MKTRTLTIIVAFIFGCTVSKAQQKDSTNEYVIVEHDYQIRTLLGGNHTNGFYIAYDLGFSKKDDNEMVETGGRLAWIIDHSMGIGLFGTGLVSANEFKGNNADISIGGGYGGLFFEPIILPKSPIHMSIPLMIGVGGVGLKSYDNHNVDPYDYPENSDGDAFMVFKPGVELEFNMLKFLRLGLGIQYRYIYGLDLDDKLKEDDLNGFTGNLCFKFGKF